MTRDNPKHMQATAMPRFWIPPDKLSAQFGLNKPAKNAEYAQRILTGDVVFRHNGLEVRHVPDIGYTLKAGKSKRTSEIGAVDRDGHLVYYVEYHVHELPGEFIPVVTQVRLWADSTAVGAEGLATAVFDEYLIHKVGGICTDTMQSLDGQRFWLRRISHALHRSDRFVYYVQEKPALLASRIHDLAALNQVIESRLPWGNEKLHEFRSFVILTERLPADES